jgi:hypothetical protein
MPQNYPNSTAIESISDLIDNKVTIKWKNGNSYTYTVLNPESFLKDLSDVKSVGSFVNRKIQENALQLV